MSQKHFSDDHFSDGLFSDGQIADYQRDGYLLIRSLYEKDEVELLGRSAKEDRDLDEHSFGKDDGEGGNVRLSLWNHPGDGIYGMFARCHRLVDRVEQLLDDEAYHYHSKMIMKDAKVGGAWTWHQDYGYWYQNGVLTPNLCSVSIAVDKATKENGCLQVLRGSHHVGRVDHELTGDQAGADMERVNEAIKRYELVYCEMEQGDALFFHSNLFHRSDQNKSDYPRWSMICCYNAKSNNPYKEAHHPCYTPLKKVPDEAIKQVGIKRFADSSDVSWLADAKDQSARTLSE